jgi:hypothetical protein
MDVTKEIIQTAAAVKKKVQDLKRHKFATEEMTRYSLKPLIEPLEKIAREKIQPLGLPKSVAEEEEIEDEEMSYLDEEEEEEEETLFGLPKLESTLKEEEEEEEDETSPPKLSRTSYVPDLEVPEEIKEEKIDAEKVMFPAAEDKTFGPHYNRIAKMYMLGNQPFEANDYEITIGGQRYRTTQGLIELIYKKQPKEKLINQDDLEKYAIILKSTYLYKKPPSPTGRIKSSGGAKYKKFIKPWIGRSGTGYKTLACKEPDSPMRLQENDPNKLCQRLRLLVASSRAGHTGHQRESQAIISKLRDMGHIL